MKNIKLDFVKVNPAGNMTILIENYDIYSKDILEISKNMMEETNLYAEQVGFIKDTHLQMMGGEFCGNASRSFAAFLASKDSDFKDNKNYLITCSGNKEKLDILVRKSEKNNSFFAKIKMPSYLDMRKIVIKNNDDFYDSILVELDGIHHFICTDKNCCSKKEEIISGVEKYVNKVDYSAFGIMFFNEKTFEMTPYVYVKGFEKGIWENSCASGTTALGFYLKKYKNIETAKINQPKGWLEYSFDKDNIFIDGPVEIVAEGKVYI